MPAVARSVIGLTGVIVLAVAVAVLSTRSATATTLDYVTTRDAAADVVVDTRPASACAASSLPRARCLPAEDFLGPHRRLANFSGVLWLLGTAGLTGDEHVLVVGDAGTDKEFVAGLLYLTGQRRVSLQTQPLSAKQQAGDNRSPGRARAMTRQTVYQASMRDDSILLRSELLRLLDGAHPPPLLDGRSEAEYWGETIRAQRGGHLPGAQHLASQAVAMDDQDTRAALQAFSATRPVVYAHDAFEGFVYLARLSARGVAARLYPEGWAGWASDGALPADSLTFPGQRAVMVNKLSPAAPDRSGGWPKILLIGLAGTLLAMLGFWSGRATRRRT